VIHRDLKPGNIKVTPQGQVKDGNELFYFSGKKLMSVEVKTAAAFSAGTPRELFEAPVQAGYKNDGHRWQVAPDGTFLMQTFPEELSSPPIIIVIGPHCLRRSKISRRLHGCRGSNFCYRR